MHYLLLIPIALLFGASFFALGRYAYSEQLKRQVKRYDICSPYLPVDLQALKRRLHCPTCGSAYLKGTSHCPTCELKEGS